MEVLKIVKLTNINTDTINSLFDKFRERVALLSEQGSCFTKGEIEIDENYFGVKRVKSKKGRQDKV
jgi:transposase